MWLQGCASGSLAGNERPGDPRASERGLALDRPPRRPFPAPGRAAGCLPPRPSAAGVIQRAALPAGRQISERCLRRAGGGASRLRPPGPPPSRNWYARRLTVAPRGTPPPAQAPRVWSKPTTSYGVGLGCPLEVPRCRRSLAARRQCASTPRGAPSALWGASRSATPCGGRRIPEAAAGREEHRPEGTTGGIARAHSESCRPARSALDPVSPAARRAESRRPAARSARRRLREKTEEPPRATAARSARRGLQTPNAARASVPGRDRRG